MGKQIVIDVIYNSALKMKESLTHAVIWINLEDMMVSENSQSHLGGT